jgi:hypothetical protein
MNLSVCSLRSILPAIKPGGPAMLFRISAAAELSRRALAQTASNSFAVPVLSLRSTGIPENAQAPLSKIDIRSQIQQIHYTRQATCINRAPEKPAKAGPQNPAALSS